MPDSEQLIKKYLELRDARTALTAKFDEEDKTLREEMDTVEQQLLSLCKETGTTGLRTEVGTASRSVRTRYWASDWESIHKFVLKHQAPDLLERRISQTAMKAFLEANPDDYPPGLNADSKYVITVRRK